jgi:Ser/Thr protein kinase RdoA (MazF antagonist)
MADGSRAFVKAIDAARWPMQADWHRIEGRAVRALPADVPVPRFLGCVEPAGWVAVAFEHIDGAEPVQPWRTDELRRVLVALADLSRRLTPSPIEVGRDHPRLGGWLDIAKDETLCARLAEFDPWAADALGVLVDLEADGIDASRGETLVHFDMFAHNVLLTPERVWFVDWPHARVGAPCIDVVTLASSASAGDFDSDAIIREHPSTSRIDAHAIDAVLAAYAGFCMMGALSPVPAGLEAVRDAKIDLARAAVEWLARRLAPGRP